jgi:hypothetical protein
MFKLIKKFTRPNIEIPFYRDVNPLTDEFKLVMKTTYIDTGLILSQSNELSKDMLTLTVTMEFNTSDDFLLMAFDKTPCIVQNFINNHVYNLENNIITETICVGE